MENECLSHPDENFHFFCQSSYFLVPLVGLICLPRVIHFGNRARNGSLVKSTIKYAKNFHAFRAKIIADKYDT